MSTKTKVLVHKEFKEVSVGRWVEITGYNLRAVCIEAPMFRISLNVAFGPYEEFKRFVKTRFDVDVKHSGANAMVVTFEHEKTRWHWMNIQTCEWTAEEYGTIAHELHHFTHFGLTEMGVTYGEGGEEVYAYFQGYFMERVVRSFAILAKYDKVKNWPIS